MNDFANKINPEEALKKGKGKKVDLNNSFWKYRILACHKFISRWAYKTSIPFHALEDDSFKMMLEVVGQFGIGLPPPIRYSLSDQLLKLEVERTKTKKLTIFVYAHHKTLAMMRNYTKKREIIRPRVTRFVSAFLTVQSLSEKKEQLKHMFSSTEWEECKFSGTPKMRASYGRVTSLQFWAGVTQGLKVFSPLVKVLRMVDADWKPSMGFVYGEIKVAKKRNYESFGWSRESLQACYKYHNQQDER
ncbi:unnamed protein product [Lactuca virosa]|uniref:Uncharacterized protein n=1 Tax=Lactuca virosa TaxID=75947 RepID=A0AAU9NHN5_9ASTR|nr:unnamed protein product [Lactuca virosa]